MLASPEIVEIATIASGVVAIIQLSIWARSLVLKVGFSWRVAGKIVVGLVGFCIFVVPGILVTFVYFEILRDVGSSLIQLESPFRNPFQLSTLSVDLASEWEKKLKGSPTWLFATYSAVVGYFISRRIAPLWLEDDAEFAAMVLRPLVWTLCVIAFYLVGVGILQFVGLGAISLRWCVNVGLLAYFAFWGGEVFTGAESR